MAKFAMLMNLKFVTQFKFRLMLRSERVVYFNLKFVMIDMVTELTLDTFGVPDLYPLNTERSPKSGSPYNNNQIH